ncbi:Nucleolar transcription factor 1-A [Orchesella cincta]|uniref:Nucleolar transcription factor 1-A n=1 Tax=Orchesella cincta TaxID=48709 RepID=A0A1D2NBW1_ORCCI|nr:Nucleolar transcription factor 1-A [Orchesella cincta]
MGKRNKKLKLVEQGNDDETVAEVQVQHEGKKRKGAETEGSESEEETNRLVSSTTSSPKKKKRKKAGVDSPVATTSKLSSIKSPLPAVKSEKIPKKERLKREAAQAATSAVHPKGRGSKKTEEEIANETEGMKVVTSMSADDLELFLSKMDSQSPPDDIKRVSERESMVDWEKVSFSCYGPIQCKKAWLYLSNQTRKYRIMRELVDEIKVKLKTDYKKLMKKIIESSPEFPVKPYAMGSFQLYCKELWDKHKDQHQSLNTKTVHFFEFQKKCYETWGMLSADDKKDFEDRCKIIAAEHQRKVKEFYAHFPLFAPGAGKLNKDGKPEKPISLHKLKVNKKIANEMFIDAPPLPLPPFKVFINAKLNRLDPPPTQDELPELKQHYVDKWKSMTNKKKLRWIESCVRKCEQFVENVKEYKKNHAGYMLPIDFQISKLITKEEFKVWADANGSPPNPKNTIFDYYLEEFTLTEEADEIQTPEEIRKVALKKFEELDWFHKELYKTKFRMQKVQFKQSLLEYFNGLPVILRRIALDCLNKTHKKMLQEEVSKDPLVFDDDQLELGRAVSMKEGDREVPAKTKKRQKDEDDGVETGSQTELDETIDGESPKKKKKKKKKKKHTEEEDEQPVIAEPFINVQLTKEQKEIIRQTAKERRDTKNNVITEKTQKKKKEVNEASDSNDVASGFKKAAKAEVGQFVPGKSITPRAINEAIRGIFDAKQSTGRTFSVYYYYAKYVSTEKTWTALIARCGVVEAAGRIIETFHRLDNIQKEIFLSQARNFFRLKFYRNKNSKDEDLYDPTAADFLGVEPKEPPRNAVLLYRKAMHLKRKNDPDFEILPWTELDEKTQMYYMKKLYKITQEYVKKYELFIRNMTPNDMVEYLLKRIKELELSPTLKYFGAAVHQAANDFVAPFCRATYAVNVSEDEYEPEPVIHDAEKETEAPKTSKVASCRSFRYRKNPFAVNKVYGRQQNVLVHKLCKEFSDSDSDLLSSADEEEDEDVLTPRIRRIDHLKNRRLKQKVKELATYYYPLEDLYEDTTSELIAKKNKLALLKVREEVIDLSEDVVCNTRGLLNSQKGRKKNVNFKSGNFKGGSGQLRPQLLAASINPRLMAMKIRSKLSAVSSHLEAAEKNADIRRAAKKRINIKNNKKVEGSKKCDNVAVEVDVRECRPTLKLVTVSASPTKKKIDSTSSSSVTKPNGFVASGVDSNSADSILIDYGRPISSEEADLIAAAVQFTDADVLEAERSLDRTES